MVSTLSTIPDVRIEERVVRARSGVLVRVRFAVAVIDGRTHVRVIGIVPVHSLKSSSPATASSPALCLPCTRTDIQYRPLSAGKLTLSPYYPSFEFFTSQMTRAPSREN